MYQVLSQGFLRQHYNFIKWPCAICSPKKCITTARNNIEVDNQFVVPHNVDLLVKYQAHINVENVNRNGMEKYLFKYTNKGPDCSKVGIKRKRSGSDHSGGQGDEIAWRLLQ
jgi:hypothetical protein